MIAAHTTLMRLLLLSLASINAVIASDLQQPYEEAKKRTEWTERMQQDPWRVPSQTPAEQIRKDFVQAHPWVVGFVPTGGNEKKFKWTPKKEPTRDKHQMKIFSEPKDVIGKSFMVEISTAEVDKMGFYKLDEPLYKSSDEAINIDSVKQKVSNWNHPTDTIQVVNRAVDLAPHDGTTRAEQVKKAEQVKEGTKDRVKECGVSGVDGTILPEKFIGNGKLRLKWNGPKSAEDWEKELETGKYVPISHKFLRTVNWDGSPPRINGDQPPWDGTL